MGNPTELLCARLDEMGVEWETSEDSHGNEEIWWRSPVFDAWVYVTLGEELGTVHLEQPMDITPEQAIAATVGAVPETKYLMALDEAREAQRKLEMCQTSQRVYQSKCRSLKETNADLRRIIDDMKAATVGAETCHIIEDEDTGYLMCSKCGAIHPDEYTMYYCWCCGRKIKED